MRKKRRHSQKCRSPTRINCFILFCLTQTKLHLELMLKAAIDIAVLLLSKIDSFVVVVYGTFLWQRSCSLCRKDSLFNYVKEVSRKALIKDIKEALA